MSLTIITIIVVNALQRVERTAQTVVGKSGDFEILQVHESRQGRTGQHGLRSHFLRVLVAKIAGRLGAHDDHVQRYQQTGAGQKWQKSRRVVAGTEVGIDSRPRCTYNRSISYRKGKRTSNANLF